MKELYGAELVSNASSPDLLNYKAKRERFYRSFGDLWPGTFLDAYDVLDIYPLPPAEILAITQAAEAIGRIYRRVAALLRIVTDDTLLELGVFPETLHFSRLQIDGIPDSVIGRLDLVKTAEGYKLLEFNAECAGLLVETFPLNAKACEVAGKINPNERGERALAAALEKSIAAGLRYVGKTENHSRNVVFTSLSIYERDTDILRYLMEVAHVSHGVRKQYVPLELLRADRNGLYDPQGNPIDVLYRYHPLQSFCGTTLRDRNDESSVHTGTLLFTLVAQRKLAMINPPGAYLLGNKAVQCVIRGLFERGMYFDPEEQSLIDQYFLPTYMDPVFSEPYVVKPVFGSEGDSITILDPEKGILFQSNSAYLDQPMVYQQYVELPQVRLMTEEGVQSLRMLTCCFLIDEQPLGVCLRAGKDVTDFSWWYVPLYVET